MVDTIRTKWPTDMKQAAAFPELGSLEHIADEALERVTDYARENPVAFGIWALGIGFVLGWKLKPW